MCTHVAFYTSERDEQPVAVRSASIDLLTLVHGITNIEMLS
jgi:hypothetical protein